jgi:O-antigen/teichoic acid export membrane protein
MVRSEKPGPISKIKYYKDVVTSGLANWIPSIIYTIGSHLGTLLVFGSHGSLEAGVYFIAFSLSMAVTALMSALYSIAYPALSSMRDGRKRFAWRTIKFSLIFSLPLSVSILFYSSDILNIFGHEYANGSQTLEILMMSILPTAISAGIINLSYSYGDYRNVLIIGLASNIPRTILYFALVPYLEGIGAALSYTIGAIFGLIFSLWVSKKIGLIINLRDVVSVLIVPILVVVLFYFVHLNFILEIVISLGCSYLILILIRVVTLSDLRDIFKLFPNRLSHPLLKVIDMIENKEENL